LDGSPRTLPTAADEAGGTAVKFYELRDNLHSKTLGGLTDRQRTELMNRFRRDGREKQLGEGDK
jgi:hypothetical protein